MVVSSLILALAAFAASAEETLVGTVVGGDGKPVADVRLFLADGYIPIDEQGRPKPPVGQKRHHASGTVTRGEATSDASGGFRLKVVGEPIDVQDRVVLWAYRPGSLATSLTIDRNALREDRPVRVTLQPGSETIFRVFGPDGEPVAGARVVPTVLYREWLSLPKPLGELVMPLTNAEGEAATAALRPEDVRGVRIWAPGLGMQQWTSPTFGEGEGTKVVHLLPVARLEGEVVDPDGKPLPLVLLRVITIPESFRGPYVGVVEIASDAQGRFVVPELPVGLLFVRILATERDQEGLLVPLDKSNKLVEGEPMALRIVLDAEGKPVKP